MTTIYVNYQLGVVMTDTRTTTTMQDTIFGIPIRKYDTYDDDGIKAIHVHDRIFVESGCCSESTKILQYLTDGTPIVPAPKRQKRISSCFLVDRNWLLHICIFKGRLEKNMYFVKPDAWVTIGSGGKALKRALEVYKFQPTMEEAITAFKSVHLSDRFTNNQIRLYHF